MRRARCAHSVASLLLCFFGRASSILSFVHLSFSHAFPDQPTGYFPQVFPHFCWGAEQSKNEPKHMAFPLVNDNQQLRNILDNIKRERTKKIYINKIYKVRPPPFLDLGKRGGGNSIAEQWNYKKAFFIFYG